jgi:hypothetical protein
MSCPSQSSWLDHPNDIWWGVHSIKLFVMQPSPLPWYLIPLGPKLRSKYYRIKSCSERFTSFKAIAPQISAMPLTRSAVCDSLPVVQRSHCVQFPYKRHASIDSTKSTLTDVLLGFMKWMDFDSRQRVLAFEPSSYKRFFVTPFVTAVNL